MKKVLLALIIAGFSSGAISSTCSISIRGGGNDDVFGEYFKIKIKTDAKVPSGVKRPNAIAFRDVRADPELGNVSIERKKGHLMGHDDSFFGYTNKVINFRFVSDADLTTIHAGTYQASATIEVTCGSME